MGCACGRCATHGTVKGPKVAKDLLIHFYSFVMPVVVALCLCIFCRLCGMRCVCVRVCASFCCPPKGTRVLIRWWFAFYVTALQLALLKLRACQLFGSMRACVESKLFYVTQFRTHVRLHINQTGAFETRPFIDVKPCRYARCRCPSIACIRASRKPYQCFLTEAG